MSEIEPIFSPLISLPNAHAPSSKRGIFFEEHIFFISSRPLDFRRCLQKLPQIDHYQFFSKSERDILKVRGSISINSGIAPISSITFEEAGQL